MSSSDRPSKPPLLMVFQSLLVIGIALGVAFIIYSSPLYGYDFGLNTSGANANVRFVHWADGTLSNTISLNYNIYADITTFDANSTYGITNIASKAVGVSLRIQSVSNIAKVANVTLTILTQNGSQQLARISWTAGNAIPTPDQTFIASPGTSYVIQVSIRGSSSVVVGDSSNIGLRMSSSG